MRLRESAAEKESSVLRPKRGLHRRPQRRPDLRGATLGLQAVRPQHLTLPCFLEVEGLDSVLPAELSICPDKAGIPCPPGPCPHQPLSPADTLLCQQAAVGDKGSVAKGCKDPACSHGPSQNCSVQPTTPGTTEAQVPWPRRGSWASRVSSSLE